MHSLFRARVPKVARLFTAVPVAAPDLDVVALATHPAPTLPSAQEPQRSAPHYAAESIYAMWHCHSPPRSCHVKTRQSCDHGL